MTILFVGRATLDLGYVCARFPEEDAKLTADRFTMAGGGPALNAAVAARALGSQVRLVSVLGAGPLAGFVRDELAEMGVELVDCAAPGEAALPVSSIIVVPGQGTRTVVDQRPLVAEPDAAAVDAGALLENVTLVMSDGHLPAVALELLRAARELGITTVFDGGSWKPGAGEILALTDYAIVSERFRPHGGAAGDLLAQVHRLGAANAAVTRGAGPIEWSNGDGSGRIAPPQVEALDTLGAGDIFHGAFCHFLDRGAGFAHALGEAADIAAFSCRFFGTRAWIEALPSAT